MENLKEREVGLNYQNKCQGKYFHRLSHRLFVEYKLREAIEMAGYEPRPYFEHMVHKACVGFDVPAQQVRSAIFSLMDIEESLIGVYGQVRLDNKGFDVKVCKNAEVVLYFPEVTWTNRKERVRC